jgi:flagella basal body P-ring formation protein FlgA
MHRWLLIFFLLAGLGAAMSARTLAAPQAQAEQVRDPVRDPVRRLVESELAGTAPHARAEIEVGSIDPRLQLAPCARAEPFLRSTTRLWGRTFVGLRCMQGATWSVSIPVTIHLFGPAVVAKRPLPPMQPISERDVGVEQIELTREPQGVVEDVGQLEGRVPTRTIEAGTPIPQNALRTLPVVGQGEPVKLIGSGHGFSIVTEAVALGAATEGQPVRVRTESGRVLSGIARSGRVVEVSF